MSRTIRPMASVRRFVFPAAQRLAGAAGGMCGTLFVCALLALSAPAAGAAPRSLGQDIKHDAKAAGHDIGRGARDVGHATKRVARTVGHGARDAGRGIGHGARDAGHGIAHGAREGWKSTKKAFKNVFGGGD